ncbi:hypothetical protein RHSIM_Rhsim11G0022700 [Rhododendron simsii]|uniref:Bulb-type lectin domain-containing protein n=1 Tax=Rhododendron simsii TaxID=118357 RepID=A0A834GBS9_RHOSS|nr:hypothetical protein RHSIM_Rhsim11G0022700 [Rhododendron simsii]
MRISMDLSFGEQMPQRGIDASPLLTTPMPPPEPRDHAPVAILENSMCLLRQYHCSCLDAATHQTPIPGNSSRRYVGIWYNKISEQTVVWVANRDDPINGTTRVLSLNQNGNLEIYENTQNLTVWHTNIIAGSYSARLLDSGNLVLFQGDSGSGGVVWQSFDHPMNTMLPNMKLGLDRRTGLKRLLNVEVER